MTYEEAKATFKYDPETGILVRKSTGRPCGSRDAYGYLSVGFKRKTYKVHRVAWLLYHQRWPRDLIDHINRDVGDNRITNLREANKTTNAINSKIRKDCASGVKGVSWRGSRNKWRAYISVGGKQKTLGHYEQFKDAVNARKEAEAKYFSEWL